VTHKKQHKNCSRGACTICLPEQVGQNSQVAEQKNSSFKQAAAILPHVSQSAANDIMMMLARVVNYMQIAQNLKMLKLEVDSDFTVTVVDSEPRIHASRPVFVCDGTNLTRVAKTTHHQRDWLEPARTTQNVLWYNPNSVQSRKMLPTKRHMLLLQHLCTLSTSNKSEFEWVTESIKIKVAGSKKKQSVLVSDLLEYLSDHRQPLHQLLKMETRDSATKRGEKEYQISAKLMPVRALLVHWTCRNHEGQLIFPSVAELLTIMCTPNDDGECVFTGQQFTELKATAPDLLCDLVDWYKQERFQEPHLQVSAASLASTVSYGLPPECVSLLTLMLQLADADRSRTSKRVDAKGWMYPRMDTFNGVSLGECVDIPNLVSTSTVCNCPRYLQYKAQYKYCIYWGMI
jgi:hypothetical protein